MRATQHNTRLTSKINVVGVHIHPCKCYVPYLFLVSRLEITIPRFRKPRSQDTEIPANLKSRKSRNWYITNRGIFGIVAWFNTTKQCIVRYNSTILLIPRAPTAIYKYDKILFVTHSVERIEYFLRNLGLFVMYIVGSSTKSVFCLSVDALSLSGQHNCLKMSRNNVFTDYKKKTR